MPETRLLGLLDEAGFTLEAPVLAEALDDDTGLTLEAPVLG